MLFAKWCALSFHNTCVPSMIVCFMCSLRRVETESRSLCTLYASLPWFCVQLDSYLYYAHKFALTRPLTHDMFLIIPILNSAHHNSGMLPYPKFLEWRRKTVISTFRVQHEVHEVRLGNSLTYIFFPEPFSSAVSPHMFQMHVLVFCMEDLCSRYRSKMWR